MARRDHGDDDDEPRAGSTATATDAQNAVTLNDEEAIRAKLRESGWEKKKRKESENDDASAAARKYSDHDSNGGRKAKENDRDSRRRGSVSTRDSGRRDRRSRSRRRDDRRDRDRDSRRRRDRSAKRGKPSSRRRSPSSSKSRSRSPSRSRRASSSHKRRGASPSRSVSKGRDSGSKKSRGHRSKSRSPSREASRKKKNDDAGMETDPDVEEAGKDKEKAGGDGKGATAGEAMDIDEEGDDKKPYEPEDDGEKKKERASSAASRKGRKSSRHHSPSKSRSPSRSSRRRRHRSRSRSPSHRSRRSRRSSRSRSRSRARRSDHRRRRSSRSKSHSRSNSRRYRRSSSKDKKRRDANSSPEPHEHLAGVPVAAPPVPAPVVNVNPTITQLMQQYPTLSLQEIIAKMQASNVTMAAAVSMKPARELYVGNLPPNVTGPQLQEFLGTIIQQVGLCAQPGNPILNTWISTDGHFAFCEMRSVEECNLALLLNQLSLLGQPLKFGRPRSFMGPPQPIPVVSSRTQTALVNLGCTPNPVWFASPGLGVTTGLGVTPQAALPIPTMPAAPMPAPYVSSTYVAPPAPAANPAAFLSSLPADANSKKLLMTNIPVVLVEDQVKELVEPFGELKSFTLLTDKVTGASTGNALFEYQDESVAEEALQGLNGLDIGGIPLSIRRAPHDTNGLLPVDESSVVVKLANMVSLDELKDDEEFSDLKEDVEDECKRFGKVVDMVIPRPQEGESVSGVGNIYVRFNEEAEAAGAMKALNGRKFGGNIVKVTYYPLATFESKEFA